MPYQIAGAKDELNLAEFPLCALANRLHPEQKTLRFEDRLWDKSRQAMITRQLTITGSDAYGLPTALDDEVLLALIQLTKLRGFADRRVPFTRYQLIRVLGWRNDGNSYQRLEASLNRWTGVTLYYCNAWWNKAARCWMNEKFHVLDNVWLCRRPDHRTMKSPSRPELGGSAFVWNEVMFRSFQAGNLKSIDFEFFKGLESAVSKRVYRFLDKRFYRPRRREFNLREFACEHIGLSRRYDASSLKRKLRPAIVELEQKGYLSPLSQAQRFRKIGPGEWLVTFIKGDPGAELTRALRLAPPDQNDCATALIDRGVTADTAFKIARAHPPDRVWTQIEIFDRRLARRDPALSRNPPGFLVRSIQRNFAPPPHFVSKAEQQQRTKLAAEQRRHREQHRRERMARERAALQAREEAIAAFLGSLSEERRRTLESEALAHASALQHALINQGGSAGVAALTAVLEAHAVRLLRTRTPSGSPV